MSSFSEIREFVFADEAVLSELISAATQEDLFAAVVALGMPITVEELEEVVRSNRRAWLERWLPQ